MALCGRATGNSFFFYNYYFKLALNYSNTKFKTCSSRILFVHKHSYSSQSMPTTNKYVKFDELVANRRLEAQRSILIEVNSVNSYTDLASYCSQFGEFNTIFHYNNRSGRNFFFIEFKSQESVVAVLSEARHLDNEQIIPVQSTMLWFRKSLESRDLEQINNSIPPMISYNYDPCNEMQLLKLLENKKELTISKQIMLLYSHTKLDDASIRLRFHMAHTIESILYGLFPHVAILPFGSSINSYGQQNCDLDLCTVLDENNYKGNTKNRIIFQTKTFQNNDKRADIQTLRIVADIMDTMVPGIANVERILKARIPIIKFCNKFTDVECDLSVNERSAYYMSELLYIYGELDSRVRPLVFIVKSWASFVGLTSKNPGPNIANFSLLLMVIFFLQHKKILPSLHTLQKCSTEQDICIVDRGVDYTFQRDINKIKGQNRVSNSDSLEALLLEFFTYYSDFDYEQNAISLNTGSTINKPMNAALYICYPFDSTFNVSKNLSLSELFRTRNMMSKILREWKNFHNMKLLGSILDLFCCCRTTVDLSKILGDNVLNKTSVDLSRILGDKVLNNSSDKLKNISKKHN